MSGRLPVAAHVHWSKEPKISPLSKFLHSLHYSERSIDLGIVFTNSFGRLNKKENVSLGI